MSTSQSWTLTGLVGGVLSVLALAAQLFVSFKLLLTVFGAVMFRDPMSHTVAITKFAPANNITREEYIAHLETKDKLAPNVMETQLDFLLYNMVVRNPYAVSTKEKIDRALELLVRHFEVVTEVSSKID